MPVSDEDREMLRKYMEESAAKAAKEGKTVVGNDGGKEQDPLPGNFVPADTEAGDHLLREASCVNQAMRERWFHQSEPFSCSFTTLAILLGQGTELEAFELLCTAFPNISIADEKKFPRLAKLKEPTFEPRFLNKLEPLKVTILTSVLHP